MPKWTDEQLQAINTSGKNIIVSAGAGSGKTAVLTERVITKLKQGIKINKLLILTFTNAAAAEMKERIRKSITKYPELKENLDYLDGAYITTFDSFTLSLVKKYNYVLNISPNLQIVDNGIITNYKMDLIDQVFDEFYASKNPLFHHLLNDFAIKNDTSIKEAIIKIIKKLELKSDCDKFLKSYLDTYLCNTKIDEYIKEYNAILKEHLLNIEDSLILMESSSFSDYYEELTKSLEKLLKSNNYDEIIQNINITLPRRPKDSEEIAPFKENIDANIKKLKEYLRFKDIEEIKESFKITKEYIEVIIAIINSYNVKIKKYKKENDLYEFTDIALMAINLLKENPLIRDEIKNFYEEICVDEYQDTSDLQEEFINLIENNNVNMVGDIKQSIYRFRNANPDIFKEKYNCYSTTDAGIKIDLLKNFRSRSEVLDSINNIFKYIMDNLIGGADYIKSHQMVFGNLSYEDNLKRNQSYETEIYNYSLEDKTYTKEEIESFIIGKDILKKIKEGYFVLDKATNVLRKATFADFCIIMDRGTSFHIYQKIFEYLKIPLTIYEDKKLTNEIDIILLSNILGFILKVPTSKFDQEFKYYFLSIGRSFLFNYSDAELFKIIKEQSYQETIIYKKALDIYGFLDTLNNYELLKMILTKFNFYENAIKIGNIEDTIMRIDNLLDIARNLSDLGYTPEKFQNYLMKMINSKSEITYKGSLVSSDSVKIMNIHKSKGLEFPICYFSGLHKEFNTSDIKDRFIFDNKYGIITPFFKEGIDSTILKDLLKVKYTLENISEEIRLFYVALTRVKEKMIIVTSLDSNYGTPNSLVSNNIRLKYNSFLSILNSISGNLTNYIKNINLDLIGLTKDYLKGSSKLKTEFEKNNKIINYELVNFGNKIVENKHASKTINKIIDKSEYELLNKGTKAHQILEQTDFLNVLDSNPYKENINYLIENLHIDNNTLIYKEYEFMYFQNGINYHGIIDLVVVNEEQVSIVDYKLKNIDDPKYIDQLTVYYNYLKTIFQKDIKVYLYSILDNNLKELIIKESIGI